MKCVISKFNPVTKGQNRFPVSALYFLPVFDSKVIYNGRSSYCINSYFSLLPSMISGGSNALATNFKSSDSISVRFKFALVLLLFMKSDTLYITACDILDPV